MKAVINIPASGWIRKGKYICLTSIRKELPKYPSTSFKQMIDMVIKDESGCDMDENELAEFFKLNISA